MNNTCEKCKFWDSSGYYGGVFGECLSAKILWGFPEYDGDFYTSDFYKKSYDERSRFPTHFSDTAEIHRNDESLEMSIETDALYYQDGENYSAFHVVGKDFGCIHWRGKEDQE